MKIYLDNCCFNRPYDDQTYETVRLETEAKLYIQDAVRSGVIILIWSFILDFENEANPYVENQEAIAEWKMLAKDFVAAKKNVRSLGNDLQKDYGLAPKDALHHACACESECNYFITTDKHIIKKTTLLRDIKIVNPIDFIRIHEGES